MVGMAEQVRVLIAGRDQECNHLLSVILENEDDIAVVGHATSWRELSSLLRTLPPHVVLLDVDAPGEGAAAVIRTARLRHIPTSFVGLAGEIDADAALLDLLDAVVLESDPLEELRATLLAIAFDGRKVRDDAGAGPTKAAEPSIDADEEAPSAHPAEPQPSAGFDATGPEDVPLDDRDAPGFETIAAEAEAAPAGDVEPASRETIPTVGPINLIVSHFGSFRSVGAFQHDLERLEGVRSVRTRRFHRGTLYLLIRYDGVTPLEERLKELVQFDPRVVRIGTNSIELHVNSGVKRVLEASTVD